MLIDFFKKPSAVQKVEFQSGYFNPSQSKKAQKNLGNGQHGDYALMGEMGGSSAEEKCLGILIFGIQKYPVSFVNFINSERERVLKFQYMTFLLDKFISAEESTRQTLVLFFLFPF